MPLCQARVETSAITLYRSIRIRDVLSNRSSAAVNQDNWLSPMTTVSVCCPDRAPMIQVIGLTSFKAGLQFTLGLYSATHAPLYASSIRVLPGHPSSLVVVRRLPNSNFNSGIAVYDSSVKRPKETTTLAGDVFWIELTDASSCYGISQGTNSLRKYNIDETGVTASTTANSPGLIGGILRGVLTSRSGLLYTDGGQIIDPRVPAILGRYATGGTVYPDATRGRTFMVPGFRFFNDSQALQAFSQVNFTLLGGIALPDSGPWTSLIRWGADGIAFRRDSQLSVQHASEVYIVNCPLAAPAPALTASQILHAATLQQASAVPGGGNHDFRRRRGSLLR